MQLERNVLDFLDKASSDYGNLKAHNFSMTHWHTLVNGQIKSPIERIYYIAFQIMGEHYSSWVRSSPVDSTNECSLYLHPQVEIGKFRVDFMASYVDFDGVVHKAVIELDGHDFHDKDKHQRAYEKSRDRFLTRQGLSILHFTGSELFKDPYKSVLETFVAIGLINNQEFEAYDPTNPLGIE